MRLIVMLFAALLATSAMADEFGAPPIEQPKPPAVHRVAKPTPKVVQAPVAVPAPELVEIRPAGNPPAKPMPFYEQLWRGGVMTLGVSMFVGAARLGIDVLTGINVPLG